MLCDTICMSTLSDQWYTRLFHLGRPSSVSPSFRHPLLERMSTLRCNPLLDSLKLYVSSESVMNAMTAHERRFEPSLSVQVARTKLWRTAWTD